MKMKKLIVAAALVAVGALGASAQTDIFNSPDNHAYLGVRASLDVTCPGDLDIGGTKFDIMDNGAGFSVGVVYNVPLVYNLYFEPGVSIYHHSAKYNIQSLRLYNFGSGDDWDKISIGEWGFNIPLVFGYNFDFNPFKIAVFTGPNFRVGMSGKTKYTGTLNGMKVSAKESMYDDFKRADVAWRFGVGFSYDHYYLAISGDAGMCNWVKNSDVMIDLGNNIYTNQQSMHRNTVSITLGYNF
jgi:hypothetical protein